MTRQELIEQIKQKQSFLCVGLDTDINKIPECVKKLVDDQCEDEEDRLAMYIYVFNKFIIDATAPYCVAYKPNLAFYECYGIDGMYAYDRTVNYLKSKYPKHFIIADAKRGDIGNTSKMYAKTFFEGDTQVDALTVAPYMGEDSVTPFLGYDGKWVILLALTSNKGSHDFQLTEDANGERLFEKVLRTSQQWGNDENMMFVVGATQGQMFEDIRKVAPTHFLLVPGVGAQGGSLEEVCKYGINKDCGLLVNSSRGIIYASADNDFAEVAGQKAQELQQQMSAELKKAGII
ncbi:MAG: orotidine-5'-phosphate decarboxylase [Prevotella sp.]|jgi:orotidine-5'-phosphate decarboxylase|nr:orotidine-5'-phosphate decarboxylase [Prevotella sp.]MBR1768788.1 orotidine-5'-phosphate decarboxylase [Prevotella sp.]